MYNQGFNKFYWAFLFIMLNFRIQGVSLIPDIVGYCLLAWGFKTLMTKSIHFKKGFNFTIPLIFLSIFTIYEPPATEQWIVFNNALFLSALLTIVYVGLNLYVVYCMFYGIIDMAKGMEKNGISSGAQKLWETYLFLKLAMLVIYVLMIIPLIGLLFLIGYFVATIVVLVKIMKFIKETNIEFSNYDVETCNRDYLN
ncbi:hypothetical protein EDC18_101384 [Natranaerovirga pectinivora]|uniref:Uncharacterized protein n=1 Tax=Natranaerovirga pectinivora TaxID=682400 RepID=A0A4R3MS89_9FIRM|nr:hypothetical protein [Natranaerovirga pectinivora]TCT17088.1 hypothetical protein EDC18_101384 [Natranaerovirga pectinivora]